MRIIVCAFAFRAAGEPGPGLGGAEPGPGTGASPAAAPLSPSPAASPLAGSAAGCGPVARAPELGSLWTHC